MAAITAAKPQIRAPRHFDWWLLGAAAVLLISGLMSLYSVDAAQPGATNFKKQLLHVVVGLIPFSVFYLLDPKTWKRFAKPLYILNLALLALVLVAGRHGGGAVRWINLGPFAFQPSEVAKLFTVLTVATFFANREASIGKFSTFALSFVHVLPPILLIFKQPHLGATLVILVAWLAVSLAAGVPMKYLVGTVLVLGLLFGIGLKMRNSPLLHSYQRERVKAMLNANDKGNAYQAMRAQIAFGAGGVTGEGYLKGEQKKMRVIPEQRTDFIFTVVGEEEGLIGCTLLLIAFGLLFYRIWLLMIQAQDIYYRMVAGGILAVLAFHTIVNLGMNLQLLPVVGLWLPFMSYGGTAIWLCMASVGLLLNMRSREKPVLF